MDWNKTIWKTVFGSIISTKLLKTKCIKWVSAFNFIDINIYFRFTLGNLNEKKGNKYFQKLINIIGNFEKVNDAVKEMDRLNWKK